MAEGNCSADGCPHVGRLRLGKCEKHYRREYNAHLRAARPPKPPTRPCTTRGCDTPAGRRSGLCRRCYVAEWERHNRGRIAARKAAWRVANREHLNAQAAQYRIEQPDRFRDANARYLTANAEGRKATEARYRASDMGRCRNREKARRRRALTRVDGVDPVNYAAVLAEHGMVCHLDGLPIASLDDLHFDHVIPLATGGPHTADNIRPAHALCNLRKGTRLTA